jgi:hypothetical protein
MWQQQDGITESYHQHEAAASDARSNPRSGQREEMVRNDARPKWCAKSRQLKRRHWPTVFPLLWPNKKKVTSTPGILNFMPLKMKSELFGFNNRQPPLP